MPRRSPHRSGTASFFLVGFQSEDRAAADTDRLDDSLGRVALGRLISDVLRQVGEALALPPAARRIDGHNVDLSDRPGLLLRARLLTRAAKVYLGVSPS